MVYQTASPPQGSEKRMDLREAVRRFVAPGSMLHLAGGIGGPGAAIRELLRQFAGTGARFGIVQSTVTGHALALVHSGLVDKLVCAVCADISGSARPSAIVQNAIESGRIELENWSLLSLQQRLMAGAFGVPFMPTRSLMGSSIATEQAGRYAEIDDPFGSGEKTGLVRALVPQLSIVHGCIADAEGNTVLAAPAGEDIWGAFASRDGVIVTVERIVPAQTLRRYSALVRIPAYRVNAVCEAPLGLHPFALPNPGIEGFEPYEMDVEFLDAFREAATDSHALDDWIARWVHDCPSPEAYLKRLGPDRVRGLRSRERDARTTATTTMTPPAAPGTSAALAPSAASKSALVPTDEETMRIMLAREIVRRVRDAGHRVVLAGAGTGASAAFLAWYMLEGEGIRIDLVTGNGQIGYAPIPGESILASEAGLRTARMLSDTVTAQAVVVGGRHNRCLAILGAGQIDRYANLNSSRTSKGRFLVGSGGANDALNASEVIVVLNQSPDRFVERLAFVTGTGVRVSTVVSTMGVLRKPSPDAELELVGVFGARVVREDDRADDGTSELRARAEQVRQRCGWPLRVSAGLAALEPPTEAELARLRWLATGANE